MHKLTQLGIAFTLCLSSLSLHASGTNIEQIVDKQLTAYNNQDIDAFLATYHDDVEIYEFPATLTISGKQALKESYGKMFAMLKCLNAKTLNRIVEGRFVTDHEKMTACQVSKDKVDVNMQVTATYEVVDGLIKRVIFFGQ